MRYKRKSHKNKLLVVCLILLVTLFLTITVNSQPDKQPEMPLKADSEYRVYEYQIVKIKGNEVYGESTTDSSKIYFTNDELKGIKVNDVVKAYFEPEDLIQLVKVEKINEK
ncbi:hypothetical protein [uncultured Metabacillus sp.]|uniref:hypothetical protein n=1 Tax=uncultured Metabacillus sp. TaxID=2860135 RepID=UPI00260388CE|nr:hypothetical protein [uncultured Metabacillus sp.]